MRLPTNCLVLVADGRKLLLLRNEGSADSPRLKVEYGEEQPNPADRDQKSDLAGQMPGRGATAGENDYHEQAEADFARHIGAVLNERALKNRLDPFVIVAPAKTLGALRPQLHKETLACLIGEVGKDLTGYSSDRIGQALAAVEEPA